MFVRYRGKYIPTLKALTILSSLCSFLLFYFLPKMMIIIFQPYKNTQQYFQGLIQNYTKTVSQYTSIAAYSKYVLLKGGVVAVVARSLGTWLGSHPISNCSGRHPKRQPPCSDISPYMNACVWVLSVQYRYVPFTHGKRTYKGKDCTGRTS